MKDIIIQVLLVFFIISTGFYACKYYRCKPNTLSTISASVHLDSIPSAATPVLSYKSQDSVNHLVIDSRTNSIIEKEATRKAQELAPVIQNIAESLSIAPKQVESATTISTSSLRDSVVFLRKELDDAKSLSYFYKDKYLTLTVRGNKYLDTADKGSFDFAYNADLNIVQYWKREHFFSTKKSYTDISSNDPRVTISGVKKFTVVQQQPQLGFRAGIRASYNTTTSAIGFGPYIRTDIMRWTIDGSYLFNSQTKKSGFVIGLNRDIIRF